MVDLVVPPLDDNTIPASRSKFFAPLGLLSIATFARKAVHDLDVRIWDGNLTPESEIRIRSRAELVGFSPSILSYESCLRLAQQAKENGSVVVFGGYYASSLAQRILEANDFVDYVVKGDGEVSFTQLLKGTSLRKIPGLVFRTQSGVQHNAPVRVALDSLSIADRSLLERSEYVHRFNQKYSSRGFHIPDIIVSQKDCMWGSKTGGCVFCARIDKDYRARAPENVWKEILWLRDTYGVDYVWDVAGSFMGNSDWIRTFHAARPKVSGVALEIYGRASEVIQPGMLEMLVDIGVHKIFIGAESGDLKNLRLARKGTTPEVNFRAVKKCAQHGIALSLGFVVGLPGETIESLDRTLAHVQELVWEGEVETISCSVLLPIPGSVSFQMLADHSETKSKYATGDHWDVEGMQRDWLRLFTSISYDEAVDATELILSYAPTQSAILRLRSSADKSNPCNSRTPYNREFIQTPYPLRPNNGFQRRELRVSSEAER